MSEKPNNTAPRDLPEGVHTDFDQSFNYGKYLDLDALLNAQNLITEEHDELLFITIHQISELWMKLAIHELWASAK